MIDPEDRDLIERAAKSFGTTNERVAAIARVVLDQEKRLARLEEALGGEPAPTEPPEVEAPIPPLATPARKGKS